MVSSTQQYSNGGAAAAVSSSSNKNKHHSSSSNKPVSMGALNSSNNSQKDALMEKLGGKDMLHAAVDRFYDKLAGDPFLAPFFANSDVQLLKWHQFNFMSIAFSHVPDTVDVNELILKKHARFFDMGLDCRHFDRVLEHFDASLRELGIADDTVHEALSMLRPLRPVFQRGVEEAAARQRAARRFHLVYTTTVAAVVGAVVVHWFLAHHRRGGARARH